MPRCGDPGADCLAPPRWVSAENWAHGQWLLPSLPASWHSSLHIGTTNFLHKRTVCGAVHCTAGLWDNGSEYFVWNTVWQLPSDIGLYAVGCWNRSAIVFSHIFQKWMKVSLLFHFFLSLPCCSLSSTIPSIPLSSSSPPPFRPSSLLNFEKRRIATPPWTPPKLPLHLFNTYKAHPPVVMTLHRLWIPWKLFPPLPHPLSHHSDVIN